MTYLPNRSSKTRFNRLVRYKRRQVISAGEQAEQEIEKLVFKRLGRLFGVRRFVTGWMMLVILLIVGVIVQSRGLGQYYQELKPAPGGTFREGIVGGFTNANPLYATTSADATISQLVFSGLLTFDKENNLVTDLAESWTADERGQVFTVKLKPNVMWHDGAEFTADDVVFTYQTIQNPDARSPLFSSWQGVKVASPDKLTVVFSLPSPLASFQYSLINGIVPKHVLSGVPPGQLRSVGFNTASPIGTGPFKFSTVQVSGNTAESREEQVRLEAFDQYFHGRPKIDNYVMRTFRTQNRLADAFADRELNAAVGLGVTEVPFNDETVRTYNVPLTSGVYAFFNNSSEFLGNAKVRQALVRASNPLAILEKISYPLIALRQPFLRSQGGYDPALDQLTYDPAAAATLLDEAGWIKPEGSNVRMKDGKELRLRLFSQSLAEYALVTQNLQAQWLAVGVAVDAVLQPEEDLQTGVIARHDYDVLLYGISIGEDADVFAYWHSSQADPRSQNRLNLSEYKSKVADESLEGGRTRIDPALRAAKYRAFSEAWRNDAPALGLYQPRFFYVVRGVLDGFEGQMYNNATDRFNNVVNWQVRQERVLK